MAPEYEMEGLFSTKSNIYSFRILMLEIVSGKKIVPFFIRSVHKVFHHMHIFLHHMYLVLKLSLRLLLYNNNNNNNNLPIGMATME